MIWFPDIDGENYGYTAVRLTGSLLDQMMCRLIRGGCS
jgi:hypothetical protein